MSSAIDPGTPGTKQARGRQRRSAILEAAGKLFAEQGVAATSIAAVAAEVDITDAGLLYHFPTKDDLVLAVLTRRDAQNLGTIQPKDSAIAALEAVGDWGQEMERDEALTTLHLMLSAEHLMSPSPLHTYFRERYARIAAHIVATIEQGQANGEMRTDADPVAEAESLIATMDGARLQWFYSDRRTSIAAIVRRHVDLMIERLTAT